MRENWEKIMLLHEEIIIHEDNEEQETEYWQVFNGIEDKYQDMIILLEDRIQLLERTKKEVASQEVRLPKITVPTFDGDYKTWTSFHDIYDRMIHQSRRLSNAAKMQYLKSYINGEPAKLIKHLEISDANYEAAWELLNNRYNNERLLFNTHIEAILNQVDMSKESARELKQLHDNVKEALQAIESLKIDTNNWGPLLCYLISRKLDKESYRLYEQSEQIPDFNELLTFIEGRFQSLESIEQSIKKREVEKPMKLVTSKFNRPFKAYHTTIKLKCYFCDGNHTMFKCLKQASMNVKQKLDIVRKNGLCTNCLRKGHDVSTCTSKSTCTKCHMRHNTLLHDDKFEKAREQKLQRNERQTLDVMTNVTKAQISPEVLLATAMINVEAKDGSIQTIRALIDQGSQASFISERAAQNLRLKRSKANITISGINTQEKSKSNSCVELKLSPRFESTYKTTVTAYVLDKLTQFLPEINFHAKKWQHLQQLVLADTDYQKQRKIDIILGADVYGDIILDGIIKGTENSPIAQRTEFGWIISGKCGKNKQQGSQITSLVTKIDIEEMKKFWEIESVSQQRELCEEDKRCIQEYERTVKRCKDGKYMVRLPFNKDLNVSPLGDSRRLAMARLFQMEKKFKQNKLLAVEYKEFMKEYLDMGHMKLIDEIKNQRDGYFLPHHAVIKKDSKTTRLRVVFDASAKTSNGESLNARLLTGPQLQPELIDIILRWRKHKFVFKADVAKMYRQIWMHPDDQKFQKILWRFSEEEPVQEYQLTTVTYGTRPAPFLAVKTMHKLAMDESKLYPKGSKIVLKDFYMDDLMSGCNTIEETRTILHETMNLLQKGGFQLRKWCSNNRIVLRGIAQELLEIEPNQVDLTGTIKALGLHWNPNSDTFEFKVDVPIASKNVTKRSLLSEASQLFDPVGWLAPTIVRAKLMFQELWLLELDWDDELPLNIAIKWNEYKNNLKVLENLKIERWINYGNNVTPCELHGFCDASEKAYAAVVYIKTFNTNGSITTKLIAAKTKVAPIHKKISLARLELCGAVLLAKLTRKVVEAMDIQFIKEYAWSDSKIVLSWIKGQPHKYATFVANRIPKINSIISKEKWFYVKSKENPADCASRGISATELVGNKLWWNGPEWLNTIATYTQNEIEETQEDIKAKALAFTALVVSDRIMRIIEKFSKFDKIVRVIAYCRRFITNARRKLRQRERGVLTTNELEAATNLILQAVQENTFSIEIAALKQGKLINPKSKILALNPFIDENGLLRVGGRLQNADLSFEEKHPIILPHKGHLTTLIIQDIHNKTMHGGASFTLACIRQKYWILKGYSAVKQQVAKCIKCLRYNARARKQLMGSLPKPRVRITRPFTNTGVDYSGPVTVKASKGRGIKCHKGYIVVFICLSTKAIHLEAVSDLTTQAFIAAFKRFTARRGIPQKMYSDNATNFQLASKILEKNLKEFTAEYQNKLLEELSRYRTEWSFIPPAAPHFGGIWEAGVKSMKYHLKRTLGDTMLTFEELTTVLAQIESCLNSRPLCPLTDDPNDLSVLTPGHFLIGSSLLAPPGKDLESTNINLLSRWDYLNLLHQKFWRRWSSEYIHRLQNRPKWTSRKEDIKINDIVLIKDDQLSPGHWPLGRITEIHPGKDDITRVVTVQSKGKKFKRPLTKICSLPITTPEEDTQTGQKRQSNTSLNSSRSKIRKLDQTKTRINPVRGYQNLIATDKTNNIIIQPADKAITTRSRQSTKAANLFTLTNILFLGLILIICAESGICSHNITYPKPGIYIEDIGKAKIRRGTLRIKLNYELNIKGDISFLNNTISQLSNVCTEVKRHVDYIHCDTLLHHLKEERNAIMRNTELFQAASNRRKKRGLFGNFLQSVFGVNDEVYKDIDTLRTNQKTLWQASQHQTNIMISTVQHMNDTETRIIKKINMFRTKLNEALNHVNEMQGWFSKVDSNRLSIQILAAYQMAANAFKELEEKYLNWIDVIIGHGNLLKLVTPSELHNLIKNITSEMPNNLEIPLKPEKRIEWRVNNTHLMISGFVPIAEANEFTLIKGTPIPQRLENNTYVTINIADTILAIDYDAELYFEMSEYELKECILEEKHLFLCKPAVVSHMKRNPNCIITELYQKNYETKCMIRQFKAPNLIWKHLVKHNTWLFVASTPTSVAVRCNGIREEAFLNGTGIIHIEPDCTIETDKNILKSEMFGTILVKGTYSKPINLNFNVSSIKSYQWIEPEPVLKTSEHFDNILAEEKLIQQTLSLWKASAPHIATASSAILITTCLLLIIYKLFIFNKHRSESTIQPKTTISPLPTSGSHDFILATISPAANTTT